MSDDLQEFITALEEIDTDIHQLIEAVDHHRHCDLSPGGRTPATAQRSLSAQPGAFRAPTPAGSLCHEGVRRDHTPVGS
ncbi:hypothetical protein D8S78_24655 [Natrialba swarupiae]|nr:hypothetical protein [Natrialba swarupiae]